MAFVDHCQTAEDVRANARRVLDRRRSQWQKTKAILYAPKIVPEPVKITSISGLVSARFQEQIQVERPIRVITVRCIQDEVCKFAKIRFRELTGIYRHKQYVIPRQLAFMLARYFTTRSLPDIGRKFGDRDHTTVMHSLVKMAPVLSDLKSRLTDDAPLSVWVAAAFEAHERIKPKGKGRKLRIGDMATND